MVQADVRFIGRVQILFNLIFTTMKQKNSIYEIAENHNLRLIETTTGTNGYPRECKHALIGFDNFDDAERVAELYNLRITTFFKRDGWQLWERNSNTTYSAMNISADYYGDDYNMFCEADEKTYYEEEVKPFLQDFEDFEELQNFLNEMKEVFVNIQNITEDEIVITRNGCFYEIIEHTTMQWSHDTKTYAIGVIDDEN